VCQVAGVLGAICHFCPLAFKAQHLYAHVVGLYACYVFFSNPYISMKCTVGLYDPETHFYGP
jgi:hypothetical protein